MVRAHFHILELLNVIYFNCPQQHHSIRRMQRLRVIIAYTKHGKRLVMACGSGWDEDKKLSQYRNHQKWETIRLDSIQHITTHNFKREQFQIIRTELKTQTAWHHTYWILNFNVLVKWQTVHSLLSQPWGSSWVSSVSNFFLSLGIYTIYTLSTQNGKFYEMKC